jgi:hypothetical protein
MFLLSASVAVVYAKAISFQSSKFPTDEEACAENTWSLKKNSLCLRKEKKKVGERKEAKQHQRPSPMGHWILIFIL